MKCSEYELLISLKLSGEISIDEEEQLRKHLKECSSCQRFLDAEKLLLLEIKELEFEPSQELDKQIIAQIESQNRCNKKNKISMFYHKKYYYLAFAAVAIFIVLININLLNNKKAMISNFDKLLAESESVIYTNFSELDESIEILDNNMDFLVISDFMLEESSVDSILMTNVVNEDAELFSSILSEDIEDSDLLELFK